MFARHRLLLPAVLSACMVAGTANAASPVKVLDVRSVDESHGSQIDGWFAWSANSAAHPHVTKVYVRATGGATSIVPIPGAATLGNLIAAGPRSGQLVVNAADLGHGDIRFYDPVLDRVLKAPAGVNTTAWEGYARVDGDYLVFTRSVGRRSWRTILYRFSTGRSIAIAKNRLAGQINGDYIALFDALPGRQTWRYQISNRTWRKAPSPSAHRANYWSAVAPDGTLYWVQGSAKLCGKGTEILQLRTGTTTTALKVPNGVEVSSLEARSIGGVDQLLFTQLFASFACKIHNTGIYEIPI